MAEAFGDWNPRLGWRHQDANAYFRRRIEVLVGFSGQQRDVVHVHLRAI